jgi:hypothetical protein
MSDIRQLIERHLAAIFANDIEAYHTSTVPELSLYEWHVTPNRIDGWDFHDFMMTEASRQDTAGMALDPNPANGQPGQEVRVHFELANYREQVYGKTAICSYTLLISRGSERGVRVLSYNESRILVQFTDGWKVVHVHKSPSWKAPFQPPD